MTATTSTEGTGRDDAVDGLRAVAALAVVAYHVATARATGLGAVGPWVANLGNVAVAVFFAVSGLLLWRPASAALLEGRPVPDAAAFLARRALRILPAYWAVSLVAFLLLDAGRPRDAGEAVRLFTLTHSYAEGGQLAGVFVAWTLVAEVAFTVVLVVLAAGLGRLRNRGADRNAAAQLVAIGGLVLVGALVRHVVLGSADPWRLAWPPNLLDWFAAGMLVGVARAWVDTGHALGRPLRTALRYPWLWWLLALEVYWLLTLVPGPPDLTRWHVQAVYVLIALLSVLVLAPLALPAPRPGGPRRPLSTAPMVFLGRISYGIYLWHAVWVLVLDRHVDPTGYWPRLALVLALTVPCAWATWALVERPCIALGRRWTTTRAHGPAVAPAI